MLRIPFVHLPDAFVRLLKAPININEKNNYKLIQDLCRFFDKNADLSQMLIQMSGDVNSEGEIESIVSLLGFYQVRNRLAASFIEKELSGAFSKNYNSNYINDIINIENKMLPFLKEPSSRIFLLGFYAKLSKITLDKNILYTQLNPQHETFNVIVFKEEHFKLMRYSKFKSQRLDWLFLLIISFSSIFEFDRMERLLHSNINFQALLKMLNKDEKHLLYQSLLNYGCSIIEEDFFTKYLNVENL